MDRYLALLAIFALSVMLAATTYVLGARDISHALATFGWLVLFLSVIAAILMDRPIEPGHCQAKKGRS
jgi:hypothetical protein